MDFQIVLRNKSSSLGFSVSCCMFDKVEVGEIVGSDTNKCFHSQCKLRVEGKDIFLHV